MMRKEIEHAVLQLGGTRRSYKGTQEYTTAVVQHNNSSLVFH